MNNGASRGRRERGTSSRTADGFLESVLFRRFSPSLALLSLCQKPRPAPISPTFIDYVVIGLSFEPCDALLQINLRFPPLPSSPSTPRSSQIARPELARSPVLCSTNNSLPPSPPRPHARLESSPYVLKNTCFENQPRSSKAPTAPP